MIDLQTRRIVLVAGKGGVGRTTVAAALAWSAAARGRRTLLVDMSGPDPSFLSPLARLFERRSLQKEPVPLAPHVTREGGEGFPLDGVLLDARFGQELFLKRVLPIGPLVRAAASSKALGRMLDAAPALNELGIFHHFFALAEAQERDGSRGEGDRAERFARPRYETLVVDLPATGHALALAALPAIVLDIVPKGPIADLVRRGQSLLYDPAQAAAVVVTVAEPLPVSEALELAAGLEERAVPVAGFVVNRWIEDDLSPDERAAALGLAEGRPWLGAERLRAATGAASAVARLSRDGRWPVRFAPERPEEGRELVVALAEGAFA